MENILFFCSASFRRCEARAAVLPIGGLTSVGTPLRTPLCRNASNFPEKKPIWWKWRLSERTVFRHVGGGVILNDSVFSDEAVQVFSYRIRLPPAGPFRTVAVTDYFNYRLLQLQITLMTLITDYFPEETPVVIPGSHKEVLAVKLLVVKMIHP